MDQRLKLQNKLEEFLGSRNVYYQPPETIRMEYPAIVYSKDDIETIHSDNSIHLKNTRYKITVIDRKPDNPVIDKLLKNIQYCSFDTHYISDNLHHDVLILYY